MFTIYRSVRGLKRVYLDTKPVYSTDDKIDAFKEVGRAMLHTPKPGVVYRLRRNGRTILWAETLTGGLYINYKEGNLRHNFRTLQGFSRWIKALDTFGERTGYLDADERAERNVRRSTAKMLYDLRREEGSGVTIDKMKELAYKRLLRQKRTW